MCWTSLWARRPLPSRCCRVRRRSPKKVCRRVRVSVCMPCAQTLLCGLIDPASGCCDPDSSPVEAEIGLEPVSGLMFPYLFTIYLPRNRFSSPSTVQLVPVRCRCHGSSLQPAPQLPCHQKRLRTGDSGQQAAGGGAGDSVRGAGSRLARKSVHRDCTWACIDAEAGAVGVTRGPSAVLASNVLCVCASEACLMCSWLQKIPPPLERQIRFLATIRNQVHPQPPQMGVNSSL